MDTFFINALISVPTVLEARKKKVSAEFMSLLDTTEMFDIAASKNKLHLQRWLRLMLCSQFALLQFQRHKEAIVQQWLQGDYEHPWQSKTIAEKLAQSLPDIRSEAQLLATLRHFRNQQMLRIAYRDINGLADINEVMAELSALADCLIKQALNWLDLEQQKIFGSPINSHGNLMQMSVIAMGKLGAEELNFSSDIDLIFAFPEQGNTQNGPRCISHTEYFIKLAQRLIKTLNQVTEDGLVFRVDMRLRPFGQSGSLVVSYSALEEYYARHGREWERYALIKARVITGSQTDKLSLNALLKPFVFRRYIDFSVFQSLREMKALIDTETRQKSRQHNIKLGIGGIREIEFLAQAFQLLRGGKETQLQQRPVQIILAYLAEQQLLTKDKVHELTHAYQFLRTTEHRLQQVNDQQTHNLPENEQAQVQLAYSMGFESWSHFSVQINSIRERVHQLFSLLLASKTDISEQSNSLLQSIWQGKINTEEAESSLSDLGYSNTKAIITQLSVFRESYQCRKLSKTGSERLDKLMPLILKQLAESNEAEIALQRIMTVIESILRRSVYLVLLIENKQALAQLIKLCVSSVWVTELVSRSPALLDEFLDARVLFAPLDKAHLSQVLAEMLSQTHSDNLEQRMEVLRYFKHSQMLRIAAADIDKLISAEEVSIHLAWIATLILQYALQTAWAVQVSRYGIPRPKVDTLDSAYGSGSGSDSGPGLGLGYGIISFGKLGSGELNYSSDLDLVFIVADDYIGGETELKKIDNLQFFGKLSLSLMHILQTRTASGILYDVDMRLRPNGQSGLITSSLKGFYRYQMDNAWTWEHQALIRARWIAGDALLNAKFEVLRKRVLEQKNASESPKHWQHLKAEVRDMRLKMRQSLPHKFDIKQGFGGLVDIEFMVQYWVLKYAHDYPQLLIFRRNSDVLQSLQETGLLADTLIDDLAVIYRQYAARLQQMSLQGLKAIVPDDEFKKQRQKIQQHWHEIME